MKSELEVTLRKSKLAEAAPLWVWEMPQEGAHYYVGADAARGLLDPNGQAHGDFSAAVCINGNTGNQAFTYANRIPVTEFAWFLNAIGRLYNKAMLNPEVTGGDGSQVYKLLRDEHKYNNLYGWLGKDDKIRRQKATVGGWETTWKSRQKMLVVLREYIRPEQGKHVGFIKVRDKRWWQQMSNAMRDDPLLRWEIKRGHDDIFIAGCLAAVALNQYPPPKNIGGMKLLLDNPDETDMPLNYDTEPLARLRDKFMVTSGHRKAPIQERLAGI